MVIEETKQQSNAQENNSKAGSSTDAPPPQTQGEENIRKMQENFPHYNWQHGPTVQSYRIQYLKGPKQIGLTKQANKIDNTNTIIPAESHHYQPMKWYLSRFKWEAPADHRRGTTNAELALDYEAATGAPLQELNAAKERTLQERAIIFAATAKTVAKLCGRTISP